MRQTAGSSGTRSDLWASKKNGVHVAFEMVHRNERLAQRLGQGFGIGDADE